MPRHRMTCTCLCVPLFLLFALLLTSLVGKAIAQEPFLGEIRMFAGNFAPGGFAFCNGQELQISANAALFSLIGTTYGGDGRTTFALPDLRGRAPIHFGTGPGLDPVLFGSQKGTSSQTLTEDNLPPHTHTLDTASLETEESTVNLDLSSLQLVTTVDASNLASKATEISLTSQVCPVTGGELTNVDASTGSTGAIQVNTGGKRCRRGDSCEQVFITRRARIETTRAVDLGSISTPSLSITADVTGGSANCAAQTLELPSLPVTGAVSAITSVSNALVVEAVVPPVSVSGTAAVGSSGGGVPVDITPPSLAISYIIAVEGTFPSQS